MTERYLYAQLNKPPLHKSPRSKSQIKFKQLKGTSSLCALLAAAATAQQMLRQLWNEGEKHVKVSNHRIVVWRQCVAEEHIWKLVESSYFFLRKIYVVCGIEWNCKSSHRRESAEPRGNLSSKILGTSQCWSEGEKLKNIYFEFIGFLFRTKSCYCLAGLEVSECFLGKIRVRNKNVGATTKGEIIWKWKM